MGCPSVARAPPPVRAERTRRAAQHTPRDARHTHTRDVVEAVGSALQNRRGGAQAAADGRSDPLAQIAARRPRRTAREVAVAGWIIVRAARQPAVELRGELRPVRLDVLTGALDALGKTADADV